MFLKILAIDNLKFLSEDQPTPFTFVLLGQAAVDRLEVPGELWGFTGCGFGHFSSARSHTLHAVNWDRRTSLRILKTRCRIVGESDNAINSQSAFLFRSAVSSFCLLACRFSGFC